MVKLHPRTVVKHYKEIRRGGGTRLFLFTKEVARLITVRYDGRVILTAGDCRDDILLERSLATVAGASNDGHRWIVPKESIEALNIAARAMSGKLTVDSSFTDFLKSAGYASKVRIVCGVTLSHIYGDVPHAAIEDVTKFFFKPAVRQQSFKSRKWDGYIKLYNKRSKSFPTGLLDKVEGVLKKEGLKYTVTYEYEQRPPRQFDWVVADNITLDEDQVEAIQAGMDGLRGVLKAPTGFGKTAVLAKHITANLGVPTLFVANKKALLDDAAHEFSTGIAGVGEVAEIKEGKFGFTKIRGGAQSETALFGEPHVVVATIQSLNARLRDASTRDALLHWLHNVCKFIMVDECQSVGTPIWDSVLNECHAPIRLFLSATPNRTDGARLKIHAQSGPVLFTTTASEQIAKGRLCELSITGKIYDHRLYNEGDTSVQYADAYTHWIVENMERNVEMIIKPTLEMLQEERLVLILVQRIDHGTILRENLIRYGVKPEDVRFIFGSTSDEARTNAIKEFRKGAFKVLIGSTIFDAGINIPAISGVVLAGAGNSEITLVQRIGRGARNIDYNDVLGFLPEFMRQGHDKKVTKVVDVYDINVKFFETQAAKRYSIAREEFGSHRVNVEGGTIGLGKSRRKVAAQAAGVKLMESNKAQLDMLAEFQGLEMTAEEKAAAVKSTAGALFGQLDAVAKPRKKNAACEALQAFQTASRLSPAKDTQLSLLAPFETVKK